MTIKKENTPFPNKKENINEELIASQFLETYLDKINLKFSKYFVDNSRKIKNLENPYADESIKPKTAQDRKAHSKELENLKQSNQLLEKKGSIIQYIKKNLLTELTLVAQSKKKFITIPSFLAIEFYEIFKQDFVKNKKLSLGNSKYALYFDKNFLEILQTNPHKEDYIYSEKNVQSEFSESKLLFISLN